ncbi:Phosphatidate cytidylyltransferase [Candidatus Arcanobacter lacustris]|jgi:phosphatidate cytidylyltransferase|uniref:Phosphatidate cytidylyltransferase n=1 Tax=Candidatus Arcanibacter lacustris TaxID=1607817 RepID=A0A0F5MMQ1_9RICK|nr:Phosphatidate cytidylyltransferase [Candidatus Arcanobacter lacustris]KKB96081.1 Phosphatidate cytidylyltransferase [Candidatus Arcanobacter lacustris]
MAKQNNQSSIFNKNFMVRSLTALIAAPIVIYDVYLGSFFFKGMILVMAVLMAFEWSEVTKNKDATDKQNMMWKIIGLFYILLPCLSLIWIREQHKGMSIIFWLLANVWATDIAAYLVGSTVGGWKIWPSISPNKTWSGFVAGVLASTGVGYATAKLTGSQRPDILILMSIVLSIYGQIGDMVESWIKRHFNVKDSGKMVPGHGGILDRVDSLVPVAPKVVAVLLFDKWGIF